jgi:uncharacterized protein (TIGR02145 family)
MVTCPNCGYKHNAYSKKQIFTVVAMLIIVGFVFIFVKYIEIPDNGKFKTVRIGNQIWMAENLNVDVGYSACYSNLDDNCEKYGRLYDWVTALTACPEGWHLPSYAEWQTLIKKMGGKDVASKKLKALTGWDEGGNGSNSKNFSALPGGLGYSNAIFYSAGTSGNWWTSTEQNQSNAYYINMFYQTSDIYESDGNKLSLFSVRCVKN